MHNIFEQYRVPTNHDAFIRALRDVMEFGETVPSRLGTTKEIRHYHVTIDEPWKRLIYTPYYNNVTSAVFAGAWWVMSGSNDIEFLLPYYPESVHRSDDYLTWRGAFGTRLRNWHGIDQLKKILDLIKQRPQSRRASMTLFDPVFDLHESKDVSAANTIHFLVRNDTLEMSVDMRSVDVITNFGKNNLFEWSLLHEIMAFWTGYQQGKLHFFINSLHVYERDFPLSQSILASQNHSIYLHHDVQTIPFSTKWENFDQTLEDFFVTEKKFHTRQTDLDVDMITKNIKDPLLRSHLFYLLYSNKPNSFYSFVSQAFRLLSEQYYSTDLLFILLTMTETL